MNKKTAAVMLSLAMAVTFTACGEKKDVSVSYTHLTLPTICSV